MPPLARSISAVFPPAARGYRGIPGGGKTKAARHGCGRSIIPHADWTISQLQTLDAETRHAANKKAVDPSEQINLLLERHLLEDRLDFFFSISGHGNERLRLHVNEGLCANQQNDQNGR